MKPANDRTDDEAILTAVAETLNRPTADDYRREMEALVRRAADALGEEEARHLWEAAIPRRRRGFRKSDRDHVRDVFAATFDQQLRREGLTAMEAAERVHEEWGLGSDPEAARRTLDRLHAKQRQQEPE